jgi:sodium/hydrogen exchanger 8
MAYSEYPISWQFIFAEFFIVIIGRSLAIYIAYYMFACIKGSKNNHLSFRELTFISYAALIRGSIAFGLVVSIEPSHFPQRDIIVSSTLYLVIFTTIIFGGLTPIV